jgi:glycogen debranching enzyme
MNQKKQNVDMLGTDPFMARAYLGSMDELLLTHCLGQLPEILDGDAPHTARGCNAQAWSVLEALRVWKWLAS